MAWSEAHSNNALAAQVGLDASCLQAIVALSLSAFTAVSLAISDACVYLRTECHVCTRAASPHQAARMSVCQAGPVGVPGMPLSCHLVPLRLTTLQLLQTWTKPCPLLACKQLLQHCHPAGDLSCSDHSSAVAFPAVWGACGRSGCMCKQPEQTAAILQNRTHKMHRPFCFALLSCPTPHKDAGATSCVPSLE